MFDKQYRFKGRHALRVDKLSSAFDTESKAKLFDRNVDIYANAPLVGFLFGRLAELDDEKNPETGQVYNQNVMGDRVIYSQEELLFNFRLIMLLDSSYEPDKDKRIDNDIDNEKIKEINTKLSDLVKEKEINYIDVYSVLEKDGSLNKDYTEDGVYLNDKGYKEVKKLIDKIIKD